MKQVPTFRCSHISIYGHNFVENRVDGPAKITRNKIKYWYNDGFIRRTDGPAYKNINSGHTMWGITGMSKTFGVYIWAEENDVDLDDLSDEEVLIINTLFG